MKLLALALALVVSPALADGPGKILSSSPSAIIPALGRPSPPTLVAVGTNIAAVSTNGGVTWSLRTIPAGQYSAALFTGTQFVAIGTNLATSPDGFNWAAQANPPRAVSSTSGNAVTFSRAEGVFVAPAAGGPMTSTDGVNWSTQTGLGLTAACTSGSTYVTVGGSAAQRSVNSGVTWANGLNFTMTGLAVAYTGSNFVATGNTTNVGTSADGSSWSVASALPTAPSISALVWCPPSSRLSMVGHTSANVGIAATSPTGAAWTGQTIPNNLWKAEIWNGADRLVAVGTNAAAFSLDCGTTWIAGSMPSGAWRGVASSSQQMYPY